MWLKCDEKCHCHGGSLPLCDHFVALSASESCMIPDAYTAARLACFLYYELNGMNRTTPIVLVAIGSLMAVGCNDVNYFASPAVEPIAIIQGPLTARATEVVEISGADSYDPNASAANAPGIARYRWTLLEVPATSQATLDSGGMTADLTTDLAGTYVVQLEVRDANEALWSVPETFSVQLLPITGFFAVLTWSTDVNDVDLHLMNDTLGGGLFDQDADCHWQNLSPDWGVEDDEADDPRLSLDDVNGYGPEVAELALPLVTDQYSLAIHYFSDDGFGPTDVTLELYFNGDLDTTMTRTVQANEVWDIGTIAWTGATGALTVVDTLSVY